MNPPSVRSIYQLSEQEVNHIVRDVQDQARGVRTFYTVDSHEVIDFCFPIHLDDLKPPDANQIADDQAALYEIFYARTPQPILIPDYEKELRRHLTYLTMRARDVYDLIEEIDALIGDEAIDDITSLSRDQILEKMEVQFNNLLAVVMGIHSTGIERFRSVIENRLQRIDGIEDPYIREAVNAYHTSPLAEEIYNELTRDLDSGNWSEPEMYRKIRAAEIDARAVDWLIHINAHLNQQGKHGYSVLYLSSAARTRRIFSIPAVRMVLERQLSRETPLYRSRAQILARIVSTEPGADASNIIENLELIKSIVKQLNSVHVKREARCEVCVLQGGKPDACDYLNACNSIRQLETRREGIQNMGLLGRIQKYEQLLKSHPKKASHREYLDSFRKLLETENLGDLAIARMKAALSLALTEGRITLVSNEAAPRESKDLPMTAPSYFLPIQPHMQDPVHEEIVSELFAYPELATRDRTAARSLLRGALEKFDQIDRDCGPTNPFHELVRCLIYMTERETARDASRGDANALQYARKMAGTHPELRAEFLFVMIWTARRLHRYVEAHTTSNIAVNEFPLDPRAFHGRSVNTMFWLEDERQKVFCPLKRADAIADAQRALELYTQQGVDRTGVRAAQLNNIAWMFASADPHSSDYDLASARKSIKELKEVLPRSEWLPRFPGFFHTEAFLEFEEYKRDSRTGAEIGILRSRLKHAEEALHQAMKVADTSYCEALNIQIKREQIVLNKKAARQQNTVSTDS